MIKNNTPYLGKIKLKFEKYPEYAGSSYLNKVHLNLGFTKLVSRVIPNYIKDSGYQVDPDKVDIINTYTGGVVGDYQCTSPGLENSILSNSFITTSGKYVGDIREAWRFIKNNLRVCEDFPHGVAEVISKDTYFTDSPEIIGYYGYTHRGGSTFKIGDRLFDSKYEVKKTDYSKEQWNNWSAEYSYLLDNCDELESKWLLESGIAYVIPFKMRGPKIIETLEEAKIAAINMSNYL